MSVRPKPSRLSERDTVHLAIYEDVGQLSYLADGSLCYSILLAVPVSGHREFRADALPPSAF